MNREDLSQAVLSALAQDASEREPQEILRDSQKHSPNPLLRRTPSCPLPLSLPDLDHFDVDADTYSESARRPSVGSLKSADLIDFKRSRQWEVTAGRKITHKSEPSTPLLDMSFAQAQSAPASPDTSVADDELALASNTKASVEDATEAQNKRRLRAFSLASLSTTIASYLHFSQIPTSAASSTTAVSTSTSSTKSKSNSSGFHSPPSPDSPALPSPEMPTNLMCKAYITEMEVAWAPSLPSCNISRQLVVRLRRLSEPGPSLQLGTTNAPSQPGRLTTSRSAPTTPERRFPPPKITTTLLTDKSTGCYIKAVYSDGYRETFDPFGKTLDELLVEIQRHARVIKCLRG